MLKELTLITFKNTKLRNGLIPSERISIPWHFWVWNMSASQLSYCRWHANLAAQCFVCVLFLLAWRNIRRNACMNMFTVLRKRMGKSFCSSCGYWPLMAVIIKHENTRHTYHWEVQRENLRFDYRHPRDRAYCNFIHSSFIIIVWLLVLLWY